MTAPILRTHHLTLRAPGGRLLVDGLDMALDRRHVAIVGRNGVGKSRLLAALARREEPTRGTVDVPDDAILVPQLLDDEPLGDGEEAARRRLGLPTKGPLSPGELRRVRLELARVRGPSLLLLDEPTEDLDLAGIDWLCEWLDRFDGGLLVVSHHRQLLARFRHFFVLEESGARYVLGTFDDLQRALAERREREAGELERRLAWLESRERHDVKVRRRRRRKKNLGRIHEEGRGVSRAQLYGKKSYAQKSQAKAAAIRQARIAADREVVRRTRASMSVRLPLELTWPELPESAEPVVTLTGVVTKGGGRTLVRGLDLRVGRERWAVLGPNGSGKTTLLRVIAGEVEPAEGSARVRRPRVGYLDQGTEAWRRGDSLLETLCLSGLSPEEAAQMAEAHRFPIGLATRPLRTLSEGERLRAALVATLRQGPELLVLDEPTRCLDLDGAAALIACLTRWPGGLIVASHDRRFLEEVSVEHRLELDGRGGHVLR